MQRPWLQSSTRVVLLWAVAPPPDGRRVWPLRFANRPWLLNTDLLQRCLSQAVSPLRTNLPPLYRCCHPTLPAVSLCVVCRCHPDRSWFALSFNFSRMQEPTRIYKSVMPFAIYLRYELQKMLNCMTARDLFSGRLCAWMFLIFSTT